MSHDYREESRQTSPGGSAIAIVYSDMGGGAAGWCYMNVAISANDAPPDLARLMASNGVVFTGSCRADPKVQWVSDSELRVEYTIGQYGASTFQQKSGLNGRVRVVFAPQSVTAASSTPAASPSPTWRRYSHSGLSVELRNGWDVPKNLPWVFRGKDHGEIEFVRWLPPRDGGYVDFEAWVTGRPFRQAIRQYEAPAPTRLTVDGLKAITYTGTDFMTPSHATIRDTCIGVPDAPGGFVFRLMMVTGARGNDLADDIAVYDHMIVSMKLDPVTLSRTPDLVR